MTLETLMLYLEKYYAFDEQTQPTATSHAFETHQLSTLNHLLLHISKSVGALAGQIEAADHSNHADTEALRQAALHIFINSLHLAQKLDMNAADIFDAVPEILNNKPRAQT